MSWLNKLQLFSWKVSIRELTGTHNLPPLCPCLLPVKNKILPVGREADKFALCFAMIQGRHTAKASSFTTDFFKVRYSLIWSWGCSFFVQLSEFLLCQHWRGQHFGVLLHRKGRKTWMMNRLREPWTLHLYLSKTPETRTKVTTTSFNAVSILLLFRQSYKMGSRQICMRIKVRCTIWVWQQPSLRVLIISTQITPACFLTTAIQEPRKSFKG